MAFKFDEWFEEFWNRYPRDLCRGRPGKKPEAKICAKRWVKSQKEADRIMAATEAWIRYSYREKNKTGFTESWPHVRTFFSSKGLWCDQEIPSYTEAAETKQAEVKTCKHCTEPVHGPNYETCTNHLHIADKPAVEPRADHKAGMSAMKEALNKEN